MLLVKIGGRQRLFGDAAALSAAALREHFDLAGCPASTCPVSVRSPVVDVESGAESWGADEFVVEIFPE